MASQYQDEFLCQFPLHYLSRAGDAIGLEQCLVRTSFSPFDIDTLNYWTPAHWAASANQLECLAVLARVGAIDVAAERSLLTPLHVAAEMGYEDCIILLIRSGARVNLQDSGGDTPLHKAAKHGYVGCMKILLEAGACTDTRNFYKRTASETAAINRHFAFSSQLNEASRIMKQENQIPQDCPVMLNTYPTHNRLSCKRSRDSLATVGALDGDLSDKRLRFSDPVYQKASELIGYKGENLWRNEIQSSVFEHAAELNIAEAYDDCYTTCYSKTME
ncbi:hypothetical protein Aperf_G00000096029 [Anoplocephala perfoliata]